MSVAGKDARILDLRGYPDLAPVQDGHAAIREELAHVERWIQWASDSSDPSGHCQFLSGSWTVFPVYLRGDLHWSRFFNAGGPEAEPSEAVAALFAQLPGMFPRTTTLLRRVPRIHWSGFSRLRARSRLAPHRHVNPTALVYHLGIVIPSGGSCGLKVGDALHIWRGEGDAVLFDDNHDHSAWNESDEDRVVLYASVAR